MEIDVFAQHVDASLAYRATGSLTIEALKDSGVKGSLLNHSEKQVGLEEIEFILERAKKLNFKILLLSEMPLWHLNVLFEKPWAIGYEKSVYIAGKTSIVEKESEEIRNLAGEVKSKGTLFIVGAGIKTKEDVFRAIKLGADGVLASSSIVLAKDPYAKALELLGGINEALDQS